MLILARATSPELSAVTPTSDNEVDALVGSNSLRLPSPSSYSIAHTLEAFSYIERRLNQRGYFNVPYYVVNEMVALWTSGMDFDSIFESHRSFLP